MSKRTELRILTALAFTLVLACFASAHDVVITNQAKIGKGPMLEPATYRLEVVKNQDSSEALFYKGKNLVLRTPVTLAEEPKKSRQTEVHSENRDEGRVITRIRVQGWEESLVFD